MMSKERALYIIANHSNFSHAMVTMAIMTLGSIGFRR